MKFIEGLSLRSKLILPITMFIALIFVSSQGYGLMMSYERERSNMIDKVKLLSEGIAFNLHTALLFNDSLTATEVLSSFSADTQVLRVKLYTEDKQLFAMYERDGSSAPVPTEGQRKKINEAGFAITEDYIYIKVPIVLENNTIAHLRVIVSTESIEQIYQKSVSNSLLFLALLLLASFVLYHSVDKFIIVPVDALNKQIRAFIDNQDQNKPIIPVADDEIGELVEAYNAMLVRLKRRDKQVSQAMSKLEEEKSFANEVVESVKHALVVVDVDGNIVHSNGASCDIFRCTRAYLSNANLIDLFRSAEITDIETSLYKGCELQDVKVQIVDVFGRVQRLTINTTKLTKAEQMLYIIEDTTEAEAALAQQKLAAGVFENSRDGLMVIDHLGYINMINPAVTDLLGYEADWLINRRPGDVLEWQQLTSLMPKIRESVDEYGQWQGELWEKHRDGHLVPMFVKASKIANQEMVDSADLVLILSDLSNLKEMERLEYLAHHDSLTGLANRAKLYRVLDERLKSETSHRMALFYIDLDGFKTINDTYGHDAGDEVLKQVGKRLLDEVSSRDLVARLSGDEFVVLIDDTSRAEVECLSQRLLSVISQEVCYCETMVQVGASIGAHCTINQGESLDDILKAADTAMYKAKHSGKGRFVICNHAV